jgi:hypothetical protein
VKPALAGTVAVVVEEVGVAEVPPVDAGPAGAVIVVPWLAPVLVSVPLEPQPSGPAASISTHPQIKALRIPGSLTTANGREKVRPRRR